ncbi:PE family protein [Mycobacterium spongiae]|uniref:PE-PPE domain-containing protein n=1 Tax=Mycobacterium spongiae TaxID=886343 RepID=A0A975K148_9MYCO|nr:PE-PPE domain-containing protein [Mycobacterium spongiae]QUR69444.1 PE-PPE domain-containing protein [Mycobacterium spongiae]
MTYLVADPQIMTAVAADVEAIGSAVGAASAAAAGPTTVLLAAAGDEVSAAIANLFGAYGQQYQAAATQVSAVHREFHQALAAAGRTYSQAEAASIAALQGAAAAPAQAPTAAMIPPFPANDTTLVIGGTGVPIPSQQYIDSANTLYVRSANVVQGLFTPSELYPLTGVRSLTLDSSVSEGVTILDDTLYDQINNSGNSVTVFGISQGAIIASLEMENLAAGTSAFGATPPAADQLNFVLAGNEMNPNGGLLARFPDLSLPSLGLTFYGGTPSDTIYPTAIYTQEYDGFADFPRYPLNFVSVLNAVMGIVYVHPTYFDLTVEEINNATELSTSPGYSGNTTYYIIETENLPLLEPLRALPVIGNPLANLVQPNLEVLVNLGYGDPEFGYSTAPADVTTPFGLFPNVSPITVANALAVGTQEGIQDFTLDIQALQAEPPPLPSFELPAPIDFTATVTAAPTPLQVVNTLTKIVADDYALLLPTADIGVALLTTLPAYNVSLFVDQLAHGNLTNAIGYPVAATVGLVTLAGGIELFTTAVIVATNISDLQSLFA